MKKQFKYWLVQNYGIHTWKEFKKCFNDDVINNSRTLDFHFKHFGIESVNRAFLFSNSESGYNFWHDVDCQWKRHLIKEPNK